MLAGTGAYDQNDPRVGWMTLNPTCPEGAWFPLRFLAFGVGDDDDGGRLGPEDWYSAVWHDVTEQPNELHGVSGPLGQRAWLSLCCVLLQGLKTGLADAAEGGRQDESGLADDALCYGSWHDSSCEGCVDEVSQLLASLLSDADDDGSV